MKKTNGKKREGCHEGGRYKNILFILLEEPANNVLEVKHTLITHTHILYLEPSALCIRTCFDYVQNNMLLVIM